MKESLMGSAWLVGGKRTPIGRYLGDFTKITAAQLAGRSIAATVSASAIAPEEIGEIFMGQVLSSGAGQAPARQALHAAGLPDSIGAATVNKVCGSGMFAVMLATRSILAGTYQAALAGGMESMSQAPHLLRHSRTGWKYGTQPLLDAIEVDGLLCPRGNCLMGSYADRVAVQHAITRQDQDHWALSSHQRAIAAQQQQLFATEIVPIDVDGRLTVSQDAGPRSDSSMEKLSRLQPAFDRQGTVTAGNASMLSDGAASVLVVGEELYRRMKPPCAFRVVGCAVMSHKPEDLFIAPVGAVRKLLSQTDCASGDIDLFEINEAFASQTLACIGDLGLDPNRVNVHGGAIALGHPIGCSGTRILVTLMHALEHRKGRLGVATLCLGGGEAVAMLIERHAT
jgi:acetyl-CoA C-acetyltransferase